MVVENSTIADNDADDDGGGIYLGSGTSASSINNSIVYGNTSASVCR